MAGDEDPELVLVRHGETEWSKTGQHTGRTDLELTDAGRGQAALLGRRLSRERFALVLTSPLTRARMTAELGGRGGEAEVDDDLAEWDYGAYEGRTSADIRSEVPGWTVWDHPIVGGETSDQVADRADRVLARVRAAGGDVALFGHGHALRVLGARWLGQPAAFGAHLALGTAAICVLAVERGAPVLRTWNERCHLQPPDDLRPDEGATGLPAR